MKKVTLYCAAVDGGAFNCMPAASFELEPENILCNHVMLPHDSFNPHNVRLWLIGHEFGAVAAVWADCEQDAWDELVDAGKGDCFLVSEDDQKTADEKEREGWAHLGNAGEPANLDNAWLGLVCFEPGRDWELIARLAEARGSGANSLDT